MRRRCGLKNIKVFVVGRGVAIKQVHKTRTLSMAKALIVKESKIEERGVFAGRDFKRGELVVKWDVSHQLTPEEIKKLSEPEKRYVIYFKGKHILMQPPAKYVNHSCDANTYADNFCDIAKKDIKKGEEITANYSETMDINEFMKCNCGRKNCRRIIRANSFSN